MSERGEAEERKPLFPSEELEELNSRLDELKQTVVSNILHPALNPLVVALVWIADWIHDRFGR